MPGIESIRNDATISDPVRRRALELAEMYRKRQMAATARPDAAHTARTVMPAVFDGRHFVIHGFVQTDP